MNPTAMGWARPLPRIAFIIATVAALLLSLAAVNRSVLAQDSPPGNNGTVKIHDTWDSEPSPVQRNEPHVGCQFHIHGFNFDAAQSGDWWIEEWPPTGSGQAASGDYEADGDGEWEEQVSLTSDSGHNQGDHFKLFVEGRNGTANDGTQEATQVKHKVFWVDCEQGGGVGAEESPPEEEESPPEQEEESPPEQEEESPAGEVAGATGTPAATGGVAGAVGTPAASALPITSVEGGAWGTVTPALFVLLLLGGLVAHATLRRLADRRNR